jgi:hypothetical protein
MRINLADPFTNRMVNLVGQGCCSVGAVQDIAASVLSSTGHKTGLSALGASGAHPQNAERDFHRAMHADLPLKMPIVGVPVPLRGKRRGSVVHRKWPCIAPHEFFSRLWSLNLFHNVTPPGAPSCGMFWAGQDGEEWKESHPATQRGGDMTFVVPVRIHGDEGSGFRKRPTYIIQWQSALHHGASMDSRFLIAVIPTCVCVTRNRVNLTLNALLRFVAWSLSCLLTGTFPASLPQGVGRVSGEVPAEGPLAGQYRGAFCGLKGDAKFIKEAINPEHHYSTGFICSRCWAHKTLPALLYTNFGVDAGWRLARVSNEEFLRALARKAGREQWSGLVAVPGFHLSLIWDDFLHAVYLHAPGSNAAGSALVELAERGAFGPLARATDRDAVLGVAFHRFGHWCGHKGATSTACESDFTEGALGWAAFPELGGKGADIKLAICWLASEALVFAGRSPGRVEKLIASCLQCLARLIDILDANGMFLDEKPRLHAMECGWGFLQAYAALASDAMASGKLRWRLQPKLHTVAEMILRLESSRLNPRFTQCFMDEDFVGRVARLSRMCHPRAVGLRTLQRYLAQLTARWLV